MIKRILVTLDGSELSESVLPYVSAIAKGLGAEVSLVFVVEELSASAVSQGRPTWPQLEGLRERAEASVQAYLEEKARLLREMGISADVIVLQGKPADAIIDHAERDRPDLIAMATHGRSGIARALVGSVADRMLHYAPSPLLLIRPQGEKPGTVAKLTDMVIPLDTSETSEAVLPIAREVAKGLKMRVHLITVVPTPAQLYVGLDYVAYPENILTQAREASSQYIESTARRLQSEDDLDVRWRVLEGSAEGAIVEYAEELSNNLVTISTHGRSGLGRWVLGSVTDKVVRSSGDPVLVVRPPAQE